MCICCCSFWWLLVTDDDDGGGGEWMGNNKYWALRRTLLCSFPRFFSHDRCTYDARRESVAASSRHGPAATAAILFTRLAWQKPKSGQRGAAQWERTANNFSFSTAHEHLPTKTKAREWEWKAAKRELSWVELSWAQVLITLDWKVEATRFQQNERKRERLKERRGWQWKDHINLIIGPQVRYPHAASMPSTLQKQWSTWAQTVLVQRNNWHHSSLSPFLLFCFVLFPLENEIESAWCTVRYCWRVSYCLTHQNRITFDFGTCTGQLLWNY